MIIPDLYNEQSRSTIVALMEISAFVDIVSLQWFISEERAK